MKANPLQRLTTTLRHVRPATYPTFPYDPPHQFPELPLLPRTDPTNQVYSAVRDTLADLGLDRDNFGTPKWNPFRDYVQPGQHALIKPNWVLHANRQGTDEFESLVTHTSVMRPIIDYLIVALKGRGSITIADAPLQNCDFTILLQRTRIADLIKTYRRAIGGIRFLILDLRKTLLKDRDGRPVGPHKQDRQSGDPLGYTMINVGRDSLLAEIEHRHRRFRVANYDHTMMHAHHNSTQHEYLIANSVLTSDFIVNVPKLKCHIKAGITGALKNLVGINGNKEYLPHHTNGHPGVGGDQYPTYSRLFPLANRVYDSYWRLGCRRGQLHRAFQSRVVRLLLGASRVLEDSYTFDGGWSGNDTIPRTTLDLNHALYFFDTQAGRLSQDPVRNLLHIVDGIVAGQGYGPLSPTPFAAGLVIGGWNPLLVDICGAHLIGLDHSRVALLRYALQHRMSRLCPDRFKPGELSVIDGGYCRPIASIRSLDFRLPRGWEDARAQFVDRRD